MKKTIAVAAALIVITALILCFFSGCGGKDNGLTVTDAQGVTYLAIEDQNGNTMAGITDSFGNLYAAEIDDEGNVLKDGDLYAVDSYTGTFPYNDTTAVEIDRTEENTYNFAQAPVVTDNNKSSTVIDVDSDSTATTENKKPTDSKTTTGRKTPAEEKKELMAEKYKKLFASGCYYIEFSTEEEGMSEPITAAVKNGNIFMKTVLEGMNCNMIYQKEKDAVYVVMTDYRVYCKMPSEMMNDLEMASFAQTDDISKITVYDATIDGRDCVCEEYEAKTGDISTYYFHNKSLVRIDQIDTDGTVGIMNIIKVSSSVDDELFELPKAYVPINLSAFDMGLGEDE